MRVGLVLFDKIKKRKEKSKEKSKELSLACRLQDVADHKQWIRVAGMTRSEQKQEEDGCILSNQICSEMRTAESGNR